MLLKFVPLALNFKLFQRYFYDSRAKNDTIFALASHLSPSRGSPLVVVRVSGSKCSQVIQDITGSIIPGNNNESLPDCSLKALRKTITPRHATFMSLRNPETGDLVDRGLLIWFPSPGSYTGEDVCEFHLHGSRAIVTSVLNILGSFEGLRPAEPGEFTRRAVMNGKMSLLQAESLPDLIASQTEYQRKLALKGLDGMSRKKYDSWITRLVQVLAHLEASIDFGEDDLIGEERVVEDCFKQIQSLIEEMSRYVEINVRSRQLSQHGARIAILGKPNSGKSTLMNLLCGREKSIVSDLSGTTRDIVEHSLEFAGHLITLCDTAGLKNLDLSKSANPQISSETLLQKHDKIEQEGIKRALEVARKSDIIIYMIDGIRFSIASIDTVISELRTVMGVLDEEASSRNIHLVINKIDLNQELYAGNFVELLEASLDKHSDLQSYNIIISLISCTTQKNMNNFERELSNILGSLTSSETSQSSEELNKPDELDYVNERHLALLKSTLRHLNLARELDIKTIDEMAQHVRESVNYLSQIVGSVSNEQVFDVVFRDFCIGK